MFGELVERHQFGLFGDADGTLALHVGMSANRRNPRAGLPILPRMSSRLTIIPMLSTPWICWVMPMP